MINPEDKPVSAFPFLDILHEDFYFHGVDPTETDVKLRNKRVKREKILDYILTQITTGENIPEYDPEAIYHYGISPVFVRYTINGIRRIWSLKDTENTNTFETRLAPGYADNSQWLDVGLDVDPNGRIDLNFEIIPYNPVLVVPFNELRPKKLIGLEGNTAITNAGTNGESQGIYLFVQGSTGGHTVTINGTLQSINPEPGKATVISWLFDGVNYYYSSNYINNTGEATYNKPFGTVLVFDNVLGIYHVSHTQTAAITFTLNNTAAKAGSVEVYRIVADGVNPINFSGFAYRSDFVSGSVLESGDYDIFFNYEPGIVRVYVDKIGESITTPPDETVSPPTLLADNTPSINTLQFINNEPGAALSISVNYGGWNPYDESVIQVGNINREPQFWRCKATLNGVDSEIVSSPQFTHTRYVFSIAEPGQQTITIQNDQDFDFTIDKAWTACFALKLLALDSVFRIGSSNGSSRCWDINVYFQEYEAKMRMFCALTLYAADGSLIYHYAEIVNDTADLHAWQQIFITYDGSGNVSGMFIVPSYLGAEVNPFSIGTTIPDLRADGTFKIGEIGGFTSKNCYVAQILFVNGARSAAERQELWQDGGRINLNGLSFEADIIAGWELEGNLLDSFGDHDGTAISPLYVETI